MSEQVKTRKKLIEVALPLEAINVASAREKSIRHGHPSTLHLWWARRPLAAAIAVIFSQMVDDPSEYVDELLANSESSRKAKQELERRRAEWDKLRALYEKTLREGNTSAPVPAPAPALHECAADLERERLFDIIKQLVLWENTTNETVLISARTEICKSWHRTCTDNKDHPRASERFNPNRLPAFHDPFAGGGALPLEAQRLGLEAYASDLNPVAVLINKAMIEIPPKFSGRPPVNSDSGKQREMEHKKWHGSQGLAEDIRYYGKWMRDQAEIRIGDLYPKVQITPEMAVERPDLKTLLGANLTVIAWLWVRTVKSPSPAFASIEVPLSSSFMLSTKAGNEAYVEPIIEKDGYRFTVKEGKPKNGDTVQSGTKLARGANFRCIMSGAPIPADYIKAEGKAGRMNSRLMAVVVQGETSRLYLPPTELMESASLRAKPEWKPDTPIPDDPRNFWVLNYGFDTFGDLFTRRQLVALTTLSDLVEEARQKIERDALVAHAANDEQGLKVGGNGARAYSEAVAVYLAFAVSKAVDRNTSLCFWERPMDRLRGTFGRQSLPMIWDYAETNPFAGAGGDFYGTAHSLCEVIDGLEPMRQGFSLLADARTQNISEGKIVSTDPPYFDNIAYADLSDFFYAWLRRSLRATFPDLFATVATPKAEELVATPYRHGGKEPAEKFFMQGMSDAMHSVSDRAHDGFPVTIYYAFKQSETNRTGESASTGWETFLDAVIRSGFAISGTWPVRTEQLAGLKGDINALASSIVLVCRPRSHGAAICTRRDFIMSLKTELPIALVHLQRGNIAPVDLAQAAIGPGMAVYTRYAKVLDAEGKPLTVRDALALINQTLDEVLAEQEGDFDADTRWALTWFDDIGFADGPFGKAEQLSKSKNTSVDGMVDARILASRAGKVRLLRPAELPTNWDPVRDSRLSVWEVVHHLVRRLESGGESSAAELVSVLGGVAEVARELAYRLYTICERKKRAQEALSYNALVQSWPEIVRLAREQRAPQVAQAQMFQ